MKLEEIDLYVTNKCNLKCDFCSVKAGSYDAEISLTRIKEIIDEAIKFGLKDLHLTGGEPTIRKDLEDIIEYAVSKGLNVRLIVRGIQGTFKKAYDTISYAIEKGMYVRVNSVAWKDNCNEILKLLDIFNELKVNVYSIFLGSPLGYAINKKNNTINANDWRKFCQQVKQKVVENNFYTKVVMEKGYLYSDEDPDSVLGFGGRGRGCYNITNYMDFILIRSNGDVYPCVFYSNEAEHIGNIHDESLEEIGRKFRKNKLYNKFGDYPLDCIGCKNLKYCHGGCRGYAKLCSNDWFGKDPRCDENNGKEVIPLCPIVKLNINDDIIGGSSEQVLEK